MTTVGHAVQFSAKFRHRCQSIRLVLLLKILAQREKVSFIRKNGEVWRFRAIIWMIFRGNVGSSVCALYNHSFIHSFIHWTRPVAPRARPKSTRSWPWTWSSKPRPRPQPPRPTTYNLKARAKATKFSIRLFYVCAIQHSFIHSLIHSFIYSFMYYVSDVNKASGSKAKANTRWRPWSWCSKPKPRPQPPRPSPTSYNLKATKFGFKLYYVCVMQKKEPDEDDDKVSDHIADNLDSLNADTLRVCLL